MDTSFCLSALEEAMARFGKPEIFNTDQGSQFTSVVFTGTLLTAGIKVSTDGRGRWMDNVFIERLWRSRHYGCGHDASLGQRCRVAHMPPATTTAARSCLSG
ncbi:MAG: DDE-type integrase/transposase/recombinase [Acetobacteraceae bacterium]